MRYAPSRHIPFSPPPLAVGDSVMLGAVGPLRVRGFQVDARGCRMMSEGLGVLRARARAAALPRFVAVALGTNWTVTLGEVRQALRILGRERVLGLVTPREVGGVRSPDQAVMRAASRRWPRRVRLIDWVARSAGRWDWFWSDGLHLRPEGARAFARMIRAALTEVEPPPPQQDPGGGVPAPRAVSAGSARASASG
jgi:hypothetical protein